MLARVCILYIQNRQFQGSAEHSDLLPYRNQADRGFFGDVPPTRSWLAHHGDGPGEGYQQLLHERHGWHVVRVQPGGRQLHGIGIGKWISDNWPDLQREQPVSTTHLLVQLESRRSQSYASLPEL